jgi:phosphatidylserine decarboxylase
MCLRLAANGKVVTLVAVAAILVASIRLHCLGSALNRNYQGRSVVVCDNSVCKGDELGWFEHGSTIIVFAPHGFILFDNIHDGAAIRMGEPLMRLS